MNVEVEKRLIEIKNGPTTYFKKNRNGYLLNKTHYDNIGILSCCSSYQNEAMWVHYGNNHYGFAVGFNAVELARTLNCVHLAMLTITTNLLTIKYLATMKHYLMMTFFKSQLNGVMKKNYVS